jgi:hypothetical protein
LPASALNQIASALESRRRLKQPEHRSSGCNRLDTTNA